MLLRNAKKNGNPVSGLFFFYRGRVRRPATTSTAQASFRSLLPPFGKGGALGWIVPLG